MMDGLLLVDKPKDLTSHDVVARVKKSLSISKVGHAGTLDPLASGLLVILLGEATKLSNFVLNGDKSYQAEVQLGLETDSLDIYGEKIRENAKIPSLDEVLEAVHQLAGSFDWEIPSHSAKKVDGKKLYEYARSNKEVPKVFKEMAFYNLKVLDYTYPYLKVDISCSKGSFIRTWANELGKKLGTGACLSGLIRTGSSPYSLKNALKLPEVQRDNEVLLEKIIPIKNCLEDLPSLEVSGMDQYLLKNGQISNVLQARLKVVDSYFHEEPKDFFKIYSEGEILALIERKAPYHYHLARVFRLT